MLSNTSGPIPEAKLTIIGATQSGKSAVVTRYIDEMFVEPIKTIGKPFSL